MLVQVVVKQDRGHNKMPLKRVVTITVPDRHPIWNFPTRCPDAVYDLDPLLDAMEAEKAVPPSRTHVAPLAVRGAVALLQSKLPLSTDLKRRIATFLL
jgi:hypothetical protein